MRSRWFGIAAVATLALSVAACGETDSDKPASFQHAIEGNQPWTHEYFDADDGKFTFGVFADLTGGERDGVFDVAVAQLNLFRPEFIISVGDLIEGDSDDEQGLTAEWDAFDIRAKKVRAPMFYVGGNHDLTGMMLRNYWESHIGPRYYHFVYKNVLFLVLDTEDNSVERMQEIFELRNAAIEVFKAEGRDAFEQTDYALLPERHFGTIGDEQSEYVRNAIRQNPDVRWTFLFLHKPVWRKDNEEAFQAIEAELEGRPYTVFSGHVQALGYEERYGRDYIQLATTGGSQYDAATRSVDHVTLVTVDDATVDIAHLLLSGILDKRGEIPEGGEELCFEEAVCGSQQ